MFKEREVGMNKQQNIIKNYQKALKKNQLVLKKRKEKSSKENLNK